MGREGGVRRGGRFRRPPPGAAPGTLRVEDGAPAPVIDVMAYGRGGLEEVRLGQIEEVKEVRARHEVMWVNVTGLGDPGVLTRVGGEFGLHPLALEDVVHTHQRPKVESYDGHLFIVFRAPEPGGVVATEQISLLLCASCVVTFQEGKGDAFDRVRTRLRRPESKLRTLGPDSLAYALLDAAIDAFYPVVEAIAEEIDELERAVLESPRAGLTERIYRLRRELTTVRRALWPMRDVVNELVRDDCPLIRGETRVYLRDCYDHTVQLIDVIETEREVLSGLMDVYLSNVSNRMNEVMKTLTVIATVFMPLTFIAGVYGMNFKTEVSAWNMPELSWRYGYVMIWAVMLVTAGTMLWMFWRNGWLGGRGGRQGGGDGGGHGAGRGKRGRSGGGRSGRGGEEVK